MTGALLADGCCCAGTASDGYALAGFTPHGFDREPQPEYPYPFEVADVRPWLAGSAPARYDVLHISPPCQLDTRAAHLRTAQGGKCKVKADVLEPVLELLAARWSDKPWVVENVDGPRVRALMARHAPYVARLCGSSFGLGVQRHRLFASNVPLRSSVCRHDLFERDPITNKPRPWGVYHTPGDLIPAGGRTARDAEHARRLFGLARPLPWDAIKEGFPPAYTSHVGADLWRALAGSSTASAGAA